MTNAQPEPSMEEILASIRRIISEDEEEKPGVDHGALSALEEATATDHTSSDNSVDASDGGQDTQPVPAPSRVDPKVLGAAVAPKSDAPKTDENALTAMLDRAESKRDAGDPAQEPSVEPVKVETEIQSEQSSSSIVDDAAKDEIKTKDVKMVKQQAVAREETDDAIVDSTTASAASAAFGSLTRSVRVADDQGQTLEALVTEMLRPMVKDWLDANLSSIVEEKVEYEVQRLARRG